MFHVKHSGIFYVHRENVSRETFCGRSAFSIDKGRKNIYNIGTNMDRKGLL